MAPKRAMRVMAHPKAKAKAKARARAKAKARAGAPPVRRRGRHLRRPAAVDPGTGDGPEVTALTKWQAGQVVMMEETPVEWLLGCPGVVIEEAYYYLKPCQVAGKVQNVTAKGDHTYLAMDITGTTEEGLLRHLCSHPGRLVRVHKCKSTCSGEETAEDLVHGVRVRPMRMDGSEEGWTRNVAKATPMEVEEDELAALRKKVTGGDKDPGKEAVVGDGKKAKKDKKKEKKSKKEVRDSTSSEAVATDGTKARLSSQKKAKTLFSGTGMDPKEKVRMKVARMAKKFVAKKGKVSSSSSSSTETGDEEDLTLTGDESLFQQASRVRSVAENYPGALAAAAISQMRSCLLQELGTEERKGAVTPVALQYLRQSIQKKATGGVLREALTLCSSIDQLVRARPAQCLDIMVQRLKSIEASLAGSHWSVSQKLEIPPQENPSIAGVAELRDARKETAQEAQTKRLASMPDGYAGAGQKGGGKTKGQGKDDNRRYQDGKKGGKGGKYQGDSWKKKDESGKNP